MVTTLTSHRATLLRIDSCNFSEQVPTTNSIESGMEMVSDNRGARVVVDGPNEQDLTRLVRQIAYLNTRSVRPLHRNC